MTGWFTSAYMSGAHGCMPQALALPAHTHTHTHTHTYEGALPTAIYYGTDSHLQEDNTRSHLGHPAASQLLLPTLQDQHQAPALSHLCGWVGLPILAPLPP
jgi:hypothetical protein